MIPRSKFQEKNDMIDLNDKFVILIDRVKHLENEKKRLAKTQELLLVHEHHHTNVGDVVSKQETDLEQTIEHLHHEHKKLKAELARMQKEKDDNMKRCEEEIQKKNEVESDFVLNKKDLDKSYSEFVKDALELERLNRKLGFLGVGFDEEIKELELMIKNESVVISENSKRSLDMDEIVKKVQAHYVLLANRDREEVKQRNQKKMDDMVQSAGELEQEVHDLKIEISEVRRIIQMLTADLEDLKKKEEAQIFDIDSARKEGDENFHSVQSDIKLVEEALNKCKQELADQVRRHQDLLSLKLALDIEIKFYQKLLEGEEERINQFVCSSDVHLLEKQRTPKKLQAAENTTVVMTSLTQETTVTLDANIHLAKKHLLFRREMESEEVVSTSSHLTN